MIAVILQAAPDTDSLQAAIQALTDAFVAGDIVLAISAAVLIALVVVLKFLGKKVPFVDVGVKIALDLVKKFGAGKVVVKAPGVEVVVKPTVDGEVKPAEGVGTVVVIKKDE